MKAARLEQRLLALQGVRGAAQATWSTVGSTGSTLFLVWTQDRSSTAPLGDLDLGRDLDDLLSADARNIFLVKATYWLGI